MSEPTTTYAGPLCHPDEHRSCGACCGMYNHRGESSEDTLGRIRERTAAFRRDADVRDAESLRRFRADWEVTDGKLVGGLPNCPFLGFVNSQKVGCLVHPLQNEGVDGRDCGVYDRDTCEDYLCAAHAVLRPVERWLVIRSGLDSYTYGLVITDPLFVRELFEQVATLNGAMPSFDRVRGVPEAARPYFELKRDFDFRAPDGILGQVHGSDELDTPRRMGPSEALGLPPDRYEKILRCLGTQVATESELFAARALVRDSVEQFAAALR